MRLFKRSNGIYYIKIFDDSGNEIKRVSTKKKKKNEALKFLSEYEQQNKPVKLNLTLKKFRNIFTEYVEKSKSKSYKRNVDNSFNFLESYFNEQYLIKDLKPNNLETAFLQLFTKSKHASATYHRILKSAFNKAIKWDYISSNPFTGFKLPKIEKRFPAYLTKSELDIILSNTDNETLKEIFSVLFHTGMRINELLHLTWADINFQEKTIKVSNKNGFTTKNKKERIIPMNTTVNNILFNKLGGGIKQKIVTFLQNFLILNSLLIIFRRSLKRLFVKPNLTGLYTCIL